MRILVVALALACLAACKPKVDRRRECEQLAAETGDARYLAREDCRDAFDAYYAEKKKRLDEADRRARVSAQAAVETKAEITAASPEDARRLESLFAARICEDLAQSTSKARFELAIREYAEDLRVYSIHPALALGETRPATTFSTADGKPYCTEGGLSGGDCADRFSGHPRRNTVIRTGSIPELSAALGCAETKKARTEDPSGPSRVQSK